MRIATVIAASLAAIRIARADTVLAVDGTAIYIDLGARDGVAAGSALELVREVVARDPRTNAVLRDRFVLGRLLVDKAGDAICVALAADDELAKRVLAGDRVRLASPKQAVVDPWEEQVAASRPAPAPPDDPSPTDHAELARVAWQGTLGKSPEARIARWNELLAADPTTPYGKAIAREVASLRAQIDERDAALAKARTASSRDAAAAMLADRLLGADAARLVVAPIGHVAPGAPIDVAVLAPGPIGRAYLFARARGERGFHRFELARDGDAYLRATIDSALVREGGVEWYVEASPPSGGSLAVGTSAEPNVIAVDRVVVEPPPARGRSQAQLSLEYVDFGAFDHYYQAEADFGYRFLDPVYMVRLGFGTLSGIGGPKAVIDANPTTCVDASGTYQCRRIDFSYVYSEVELRLRPNVALLLRPQVGRLSTDRMADSGAGRCATSGDQGCEFATGFGARVRLRLGPELGTNLVLGIAATRGVGTLFEASYHWLPAPVVPIRVSVQVTDEPVLQDYGVRLIGDLGFRKLTWVYPSIRLSYQARDLNHTGASGGMSLTFDW